MPNLVTLILLLIAPAPVDRDTALSEVEAPAPATPEPTADEQASRAPIPPPRLAVDPTPMPAPPPPPAPPARPIRWRVDLVADIGGTVLGDRAWRAFDDNHHTMLTGLSKRSDARLGRSRIFLGGGVAVRSLGSRGNLYDNPWTRARVREPLLFARLSGVVVEGLDLFVQVGGGPSVVDLEFSSTRSASQRAVVGMVDGQGGVAVYLPKQWLPRRGASRVTGGFELAAGYTWRSAVDVRPKLATDPEPIPTRGAALGDLSLRGVVWRLGLFVRFQ